MDRESRRIVSDKSIPTDLSRSGIYDGIVDKENAAHGNNFGLYQRSFVGDLQKDNSSGRIKPNTRSPNTTEDENETSNINESSNEKFGSMKDWPSWRKMVFDPAITSAFDSPWPRITLRTTNHRTSEPFAVQKGGYDSKDNLYTHKETKKSTTFCVIGIGFLILILIAVSIIVIVTLPKDVPQVVIENYKIKMELSINQTFTKDHNDTQSLVYKAFTGEFCSEIDKLYTNTTNEYGSYYKGCIVTKLKQGSIVVEFSLYMSRLNQVGLNTSDVKLNSILNTTGYKLGSYAVDKDSLRLVGVEKSHNIPVFSTASQSTTKTPMTSSESVKLKDETTSVDNKISTTTTPDTKTLTSTTTATQNTRTLPLTTTTAQYTTTLSSTTTQAPDTKTPTSSTTKAQDTRPLTSTTTTAQETTTLTSTSTTTTALDTTTRVSTTTTALDTTTRSSTTTTTPDTTTSSSTTTTAQDTTTRSSTTTTTSDTTTRASTTTSAPDTTTRTSTTTTPLDTTTRASTTTTVLDTTTRTSTTTTAPDTTTRSPTATTAPDTTTLTSTTTTAVDTTTRASTTSTAPDTTMRVSTTTTALDTTTRASTTTTAPVTTTPTSTTTTALDTTTPTSTTTTAPNTTTRSSTFTTAPEATMLTSTTTTAPGTTMRVSTTTTALDTTTRASTTTTTPNTTTSSSTTTTDQDTTTRSSTTTTPDTTARSSTTTTAPDTTTLTSTTTTAPDTTMGFSTTTTALDTTTRASTTTTTPDTTTSSSTTTTAQDTITHFSTTTTTPDTATRSSTTTTAPDTTTRASTTTTASDATSRASTITTAPDTTSSSTTTTASDTTTRISNTTSAPATTAADTTLLTANTQTAVDTTTLASNITLNSETRMLNFTSTTAADTTIINLTISTTVDTTIPISNTTTASETRTLNLTTTAADATMLTLTTTTAIDTTTLFSNTTTAVDTTTLTSKTTTVSETSALNLTTTTAADRTLLTSNTTTATMTLTSNTTTATDTTMLTLTTTTARDTTTLSSNTTIPTYTTTLTSNTTIPTDTTTLTSNTTTATDTKMLTLTTTTATDTTTLSSNTTTSKDTTTLTSNTTAAKDTTTLTSNTTTATDTILLTLSTTTVIPYSNRSTENETQYSFADMTVKLNSSYSAALNDTSSNEYLTLSKQLCSEMDKAYSNTTGGFGNNYYGCEITSVVEGSIIVTVRIYCIQIQQTELTEKSTVIFNRYASNGLKLGSATVAVIAVQLIKVQTELRVDKPNIITTVPTTKTSTNALTQSTTVNTNFTILTQSSTESVNTNVTPERTETTPTIVTTKTSTSTENMLSTETNSSSKTTAYTTLSTPEYHNLSVTCYDATFEINSHVVFACGIRTSDIDEIKLKKMGRNPSTLATIDSNGTVFYTSPSSFIVKYFAGEKVELEFLNISCSDEGTYETYVMRNTEEVHSKAQISVQKRPSMPRLNMHPDQVIDLQFYRKNSENECHGDVGYPPGRLVIEVQRYNSTVYEAIPSIDIAYVENSTTFGNCSYTQYLRFGMNYTEDMDKGKIRCRVESVVTKNDDISVETDLRLIPRDICSCNTGNGIKRGHPKRCNVYVECVEKVYPVGVACPAAQCRNSINGVCGSNCSDAVCNEAVPQSFCTTPPPSTTTPAPTPYISCNASMSVMLFSGSVVISCTLNQTSFDVINITKISTRDSMTVIADILQDGTVIHRTSNDNFAIRFQNEVLSIILMNVTCADEGVYRVLVVINGETAIAQTQISVYQKPKGIPLLKLNADQIADLGTYRNWLLHSCTSDIGYPLGQIQMDIEILMNGENDFKMYNITGAVGTTDTTKNCMISRTIEFGIAFTSNMDDAIIRCVVKDDQFKTNSKVYSNNESVSLIPYNFCQNNTETRSFHKHPEDCSKFVQCEGNVTYGKQCPAGLCFGVNSVASCDYCANVQCDVMTTQTTTVIVTTSTTAENMRGISCNQSISALLFSGPVTIICQINATTRFDLINITGPAMNDQIATILPDETVYILQDNDNIDIKYKQNIISFIIHNISCSHEGFIRFTMDYMGDLTVSETRLNVKKKPNGYASLKLNPDQIVNLGFYRADSKHECLADIGYPAGKIKVEILKKGENEFSLLNVTSSILDSINNCTITREMKFGIVFTSDMDEAVIRCRIDSISSQTNTPIYSNNETLSLISDTFCENSTTVPSFKQHPTDCTKFVLCEGNNVYGRSCEPGRCFGAYSSNYCDYCYNVICRPTTEATTLPSIATTAENPSTPILKMNCTQKSDFISSGPVYIQCSFQLPSSLIGINISRTSNSTNQLIATVSSDGTVTMVNPAGIQISYTQTHVGYIELRSSVMSCVMEATYHFVAQQDNVTFKGIETLIAKVKPGKPTLLLTHQTVLGQESGQSICSANVGNPEGSIHILVKGENETEYRKYVGYAETITKKKLECNTNIELVFTLVFTSNWNNTKIKCQVENDGVIDANEDMSNYTSNVSTVVLIQADYCAGFTGFKRHPRNDCTYFIQCASGRIFSQMCTQPLCFNGNNNSCDHCYNVNATCNFP